MLKDQTVCAAGACADVLPLAHGADILKSDSDFGAFEVYSRLGTGKLAPVGQGTAPPLPWLSGGPRWIWVPRSFSGRCGFRRLQAVRCSRHRRLSRLNVGSLPAEPTPRCATFVNAVSRRSRLSRPSRRPTIEQSARLRRPVLLATGQPELAVAAARAGALRAVSAAALPRAVGRGPAPPTPASASAGATCGARYMVGYAINNVFPLGGGNIAQLFLTRIAIPSSSYPTVAAALVDRGACSTGSWGC